MARWNDVLNDLGNDGARKNAARAVEERLRAEGELDTFLARFAHPAGGAEVPEEQKVA